MGAHSAHPTSLPKTNPFTLHLHHTMQHTHQNINRAEAPAWGATSPYFTLRELTASATALRHGIDNTPTTAARHMLAILVERLLHPIRVAWQAPIIVTSGYRCPDLNRLVGGTPRSHHLLGCAADLTAGSRQANRLLFDLIQQMHRIQLIRYTQLIAEDNYRWLHLAYVPSDLRGQAIVCQQPTPVTADEVPAEVTIKDSS